VTVLGSAFFCNIGTLISGDIRQPILHASSVYVEDGVIREIGTQRQADIVIDVRGATLAPGLWDAHHHPYFGEYSPRQEIFNTMAKTVRAGTTSVVSAGSGHQPGMYLPSESLPNVQAHAFSRRLDPARARDAIGTKALAIVMRKSWQSFRPHGIKCYAGTVIAEDGLTADDFAEMAEAGIQRVKFIRPVSSVKDCERYRQWAHDHGMLTMTHTGNRSLIKEIESIGESLRVIRPDAALHVNGGPTPAPPEDVDWIVRETPATLDLVFIGNMPLARRVLECVRERDELDRVVIGSDLPGGSGYVPGAILRTVALLSHLTDIPVAQLICMATGNTARNFGLPGGLIEPGQPADLVAWDPVDGSVTDEFLECVEYGDRPYPGLIMIDGEIVEHGNPLLLDPKRTPTVTRSPSPREAHLFPSPLSQAWERGSAFRLSRE